MFTDFIIQPFVKLQIFSSRCKTSHVYDEGIRRRIQQHRQCLQHIQASRTSSASTNHIIPHNSMQVSLPTDVTYLFLYHIRARYVFKFFSHIKLSIIIFCEEYSLFSLTVLKCHQIPTEAC